MTEKLSMHGEPFVNSNGVSVQCVSTNKSNNYLFANAYGESKQQASKRAKFIILAPLMLEKLKETLDVLKWYMNNTHPEDNQHESFFNIGMNDISQIEELIKKAL